MADDLGDVWWNKEGEESGTDRTASNNDRLGDESSRKSEVHMHSKKRSQSHSDISKKQYDLHRAGVTHETEHDKSGEPKKKRRKKKRLSQHLAETDQKAGRPKDVMSALAHHYKGKLSAIEMQELQLSDKCFLPCNTPLDSLSDYLKSCIPKWIKLIEKNKPASPRTCLLLMVTASAKRAVDLNRQAAEFKGQCVSAKLFAKHMKMQDQVKLLNKRGAHFAVGTPNRISSLIQQDALLQEEMRYVILDWNWRDVKLRRMVDVPEVRKDLFELMSKYLIPASRTSKKLQIGLF